jgi:hypothetical protein
LYVFPAALCVCNQTHSVSHSVPKKPKTVSSMFLPSELVALVAAPSGAQRVFMIDLPRDRAAVYLPNEEPLGK